MVRYARTTRNAGLILLLLLLTGCSTFGFLFDRLAWLSSWQFDRMFGTDQAQEQLVRSGADRMGRWLTETGFPTLIENLETARTLWESGQHVETVDLLDATFDDSRQQLHNHKRLRRA